MRIRCCQAAVGRAVSSWSHIYFVTSQKPLVSSWALCEPSFLSLHFVGRDCLCSFRRSGLHLTHHFWFHWYLQSCLKFSSPSYHDSMEACVLSSLSKCTLQTIDHIISENTIHTWPKAATYKTPPVASPGDFSQEKLTALWTWPASSIFRQ